MAIVDQLHYLWVKFSHAMVVSSSSIYSMAIVDQLDYLWVKFSHAMVVSSSSIVWL